MKETVLVINQPRDKWGTHTTRPPKPKQTDITLIWQCWSIFLKHSLFSAIRMYRKPGKPLPELPQPQMNRAVVAVKHHEAHDQSGTNSTRTKIPSYFTSSQASSMYTRVDIYLPKQTKQQQKNQPQAFLALVAAMRPQIHFPSSYKCSRSSLTMVCARSTFPSCTELPK